MVDMTNLDELEKSYKPNSKMIWIETPTNPTLKILDIELLCKWAKSKNLISVVDNTFATPYLQIPIRLGCDIVVHSCTKYMGGHCDVVLGALTTNSKEFVDKLWFSLNSTGFNTSPFDSYLVLRGLKTLKIRMDAHCKNAMNLARYLEKHHKVERVLYPGLESHP